MNFVFHQIQNDAKVVCHAVFGGGVIHGDCTESRTVSFPISFRPLPTVYRKVKSSNHSCKEQLCLLIICENVNKMWKC